MNSFYNLKMSLLIGNICFAWTGDYEALKTFVANDLKLNGNGNSLAEIKKSSTLIITQSPGEGMKAFYKSRVMKWVT